MASDPDPSPTADPPVDPPPPVEAAPAKRKRGRKRKDEETGTATPNERKKRLASSSPTMERPSRERKTVERLIQMSLPKVPVSKVLIVMQGPGTKLKDIPNVFFKLSKRKTDDNLQVLHTILFGRKSNAYFLKRNLSQFSGFVWAGNEEKQRVRVKEKLDKCTKDRLLDFSELLDIHIAKTAAKKEEIAEKLLEFLESPHATRDVVLAEQKGKRKRRTKGIGQSAAGGASSERETKEHKSSADTRVKKRQRQSDKTKEQDNNEDGLDKKDVDEDGSAEEEGVDGGGSINEDDLYNAGEADGDTKEDNDHVKSEEEDDSAEPEESMADTKGSDEKHKTAERKIKEKASPVKKSYPVKSDKSPFKSVHEKAFSDAEDVPSVGRIKRGSSEGQASRLSKTNTKEKAAVVNKESFKSPKNIRKSSSRKKTLDDSDSGLPSSSKPKKETKKKDQSNDNPVHKENKTVKKQTIASKVSTKEQGKGKARRTAKVSPSTEELHSVVSNILKEVDFNTATLADILKQLGDHFNTNLMDRKAEVKQIIQDVINSMTDDEDGEDDGDVTGDAEAGEGAREESNGDGE